MKIIIKEDELKNMIINKILKDTLVSYEIEDIHIRSINLIDIDDTILEIDIL